MEERFACAEACLRCARACARHAGTADPAETGRRDLNCVEICDKTARLLSEQGDQDEEELRFRVEWSRTACLECAAMCEERPGSRACAEACLECASICALFLATLSTAC
ncbi:four-helix bundle copper-binding protein [Streptomyces tsukubensis]|uniref:Ferredoxin n=1 Tax=Streptomyces tsukubensis TaxID=83656 RepID=A0A1V4A8J0_9ACTN|nr:hypothetical protein B1H18_17225 [Streptomyces tsukubensis]QFR98203.1 four-helix bundle copper-binding protein [Streptomyces tsukubensis]